MSTLDLRMRATLIGMVAVLLWALLALFTTEVRAIPPFELVSLCFGVAALASALWIARPRRGKRDVKKGATGIAAFGALRQPLGAWVLGVGGLFGYHFFYFVALAHAPAVDASLIAYLWPLFIVLFSALLPGERLRWNHVAGALCGLGGAAVLIGRKGGFQFDPAFAYGYGAAVVCSLVWSGYSVLNRRYARVPVEAVCGFCAGTAALGMVTHLALESWVAPDAGQWLAIAGLGLGPVGAAFFVWDYGTKHGDLQLLGVSSYGAPLLSTLILIATGRAEASANVVGGCLMIVGGALLASGVGIRGRKRLSRQ